MEKERRKYPRFRIDNAVTINPEGVYQLVDISQGGFRFKCHPNTLLPETWETDIINSFIPLEKYSSKIAWLSLIKNKNFNTPELMLIGVKFIKLNREKKQKLTNLLQNILKE